MTPELKTMLQAHVAELNAGIAHLEQEKQAVLRLLNGHGATIERAALITPEETLATPCGDAARDKRAFRGKSATPVNKITSALEHLHQEYPFEAGFAPRHFRELTDLSDGDIATAIRDLLKSGAITRSGVRAGTRYAMKSFSMS